MRLAGLVFTLCLASSLLVTPADARRRKKHAHRSAVSSELPAPLEGWTHEETAAEEDKLPRSFGWIPRSLIAPMYFENPEFGNARPYHGAYGYGPLGAPVAGYGYRPQRSPYPGLADW